MERLILGRKGSALTPQAREYFSGVRGDVLPEEVLEREVLRRLKAVEA